MAHRAAVARVGLQPAHLATPGHAAEDAATAHRPRSSRRRTAFLLAATTAAAAAAAAAAVFVVVVTGRFPHVQKAQRPLCAFIPPPLELRKAQTAGLGDRVTPLAANPQRVVVVCILVAVTVARRRSSIGGSGSGGAAGRVAEEASEGNAPAQIEQLFLLARSRAGAAPAASLLRRLGQRRPSLCLIFPDGAFAVTLCGAAGLGRPRRLRLLLAPVLVVDAQRAQQLAKL